MTRTMLNRQIALATKRLSEADSQEAAESAEAQISELKDALAELDASEREMAVKLASK